MTGMLMTHELEQKIRDAVMRSLIEDYVHEESWQAAADAAIDAVRDYNPGPPGGLRRQMDGYCVHEGCATPGLRPTWRVRKPPTEDDPSGGIWEGACARHLNAVSDRITHGERVALELERQTVRER